MSHPLIALPRAVSACSAVFYDLSRPRGKFPCLRSLDRPSAVFSASWNNDVTAAAPPPGLRSGHISLQGPADGCEMFPLRKRRTP